MSIFILQEHLDKNEQYWIEWCKSHSGKIGYELRQAHYHLGIHLGNTIHRISSNQSKFVLLILMRAGLPFGLGIADGLEKQGNDVTIHFVDDKIDDDVVASINHQAIILVDAVINSGQSIQNICKKLPQNLQQSMMIATTVIPKSAISKFKDLNLMTVRVSDNQYQGAKVSTIQNGKGPDTGDRLFGTL